MPARPSVSRPRPAWELPDHVHAAAVDDDLVFLDVRADAYRCFPGGAATCRIADEGAALHISAPDVASDLLAAGLVRAPGAAAAPPGRRRVQAPTQSLLKRSYPLPAWRDAPAIAGAVLDVALAYRGRPLSRIVARNRGPAARRAGSTLEATLDGFHRWIPYAPVSGKCLLRAFMLRRVLHAHGHPHDWVFGVTLWPFKAHCWLQSEGLVLDDTVENVSAYRPIMVV